MAFLMVMTWSFGLVSIWFTTFSANLNRQFFMVVDYMSLGLLCLLSNSKVAAAFRLKISLFWCGHWRFRFPHIPLGERVASALNMDALHPNHLQYSLCCGDWAHLNVGEHSLTNCAAHANGQKQYSRKPCAEFTKPTSAWLQELICFELRRCCQFTLAQCAKRERWFLTPCALWIASLCVHVVQHQGLGVLELIISGYFTTATMAMDWKANISSLLTEFMSRSPHLWKTGTQLCWRNLVLRTCYRYCLWRTIWRDPRYAMETLRTRRPHTSNVRTKAWRYRHQFEPLTIQWKAPGRVLNGASTRSLSYSAI